MRETWGEWLSLAAAVIVIAVLVWIATRSQALVETERPMLVDPGAHEDPGETLPPVTPDPPEPETVYVEVRPSYGCWPLDGGRACVIWQDR